jgi:hypothetical protein
VTIVPTIQIDVTPPLVSQKPFKVFFKRYCNDKKINWYLKF